MTVCRWLDVAPNRTGVRVHRGSECHRCGYPEPELPPLPASVTRYFAFNWPPPRTYVSKEMCAECPVREERGHGDD